MTIDDLRCLNNTLEGFDAMSIKDIPEEYALKVDDIVSFARREIGHVIEEIEIDENRRKESEPCDEHGDYIDTDERYLEGEEPFGDEYDREQWKILEGIRKNSQIPHREVDGL